MYSVFVELLQRFNVSAYKVAKETGVSQTTMSNWKSGRSIPKHEIMAKIAKYFNVSEEYLMTGVEKEGGEDYYLNEETKKIAQAIFENEDLRKLFDVSKDMSPEQIKAFKIMIDTFITKDKKSKQKD